MEYLWRETKEDEEARCVSLTPNRLVIQIQPWIVVFVNVFHSAPTFSLQDASEVSSLQSNWLNGYEAEVKTAIWVQLGQAWKSLLEELSSESEAENIVVAVGHPLAHIALMGHCLNLTKEWMGSFHLDAGSISVIDFPDGPAGRGVIRCINYTAHLGRWSIPITRSVTDDEAF